MPRCINEAWITATAGGGGTLYRKVGQDGVSKLEVEDDTLNPAC